VKQNKQHVEVGRRWVLYHGTSSARLKRILEQDRLRRATVGDQKIALTTDRSVAEYSACNAVFADRHDRPSEDSSAVVLMLDAKGLLVLNYELVQFSDPVWGDGECDWENEIECWDDIEPLKEVLIAVEPVASERCQH
jgi:RNA:NAD 2'-phosphotransferase (TPT1/KptA family)